jgi:hypothetical protein
MFIQFAHSNAKNPDTETSRSLVTKAQSLQRYGFSQELLLALRDFMHQCAQAENDLSLCICLANIMTKKSDELRALEHVRSASKKLGIALPGILEIALNMMADAHKTTLDFFIEICRAHGFFPKLLRTIEVIGSFDKTLKGSILDSEFEKMSAYFPERTPNVDWENIAALLSQFFAAEEIQKPGSNLAEFLKQCLADSRLKEELAGVVKGEGAESIFSGDVSSSGFIGIDLTKIAINWTNVVSSWRDAVESRLVVTPHPDEAGPEGYNRYLATLPPDVQQGIYRLPFLLVTSDRPYTPLDPACCFWPLLEEFRSNGGDIYDGRLTDSILTLAFKFVQHPQFFYFIEDSIAKIATGNMHTIQYELTDAQKKERDDDLKTLKQYKEEQLIIKNLMEKSKESYPSEEYEAMDARLGFLNANIPELEESTTLPTQLIDLKKLMPREQYHVGALWRTYTVFFKLVHWVRQCCGGPNLDYTGSDPARVEMVTQLSNMWRTLQVHVLPVKVLHDTPFGNFDNILSTISDVSIASLYVQAQSYVITEHSGIWLKLISHHDWSGRTFLEYILAQSIYPDNPFFDNIIKSITKGMMVTDANRFNSRMHLNEKLIEQCKQIGNRFVRVPTDAENNPVFKIEKALDSLASTSSAVLLIPRHIMESVAQVSSARFISLLEVVYDGISVNVIESFNNIARLDKQLVPVLIRALRVLDHTDIRCFSNAIRFIWHRDKSILLNFLSEEQTLSSNVVRMLVAERMLYGLTTSSTLQDYETYNGACPANDFMERTLMPCFMSFWQRFFYITLETYSRKLYSTTMDKLCRMFLSFVNRSKNPVLTARNIISNAFILFAPKSLPNRINPTVDYLGIFASNFNDLFAKKLNPKLLYKVLAADGTLSNTIFRSFVSATTQKGVNIRPVAKAASMRQKSTAQKGFRNRSIPPCEWSKDTNLQALTNPDNEFPIMFLNGFFDALNAAEFRYQELRAAGLALVDDKYDFERTSAYKAREETFLAERREMQKGEVLNQSPEEHWPALHFEASSSF